MLYATKRFAITWCAPHKAIGHLSSRGRRSHALNALWDLRSCLYIAFELSSALSLAREILETSVSHSSLQSMLQTQGALGPARSET